MVFRLQSKGINIDTNSWAVSVVLVRLGKVKVSSVSGGETVVSIQLEFGLN